MRENCEFYLITMENYNVCSVSILSHSHQPLLLFACSQVQKLGEYLSLVHWLKEDSCTNYHHSHQKHCYKLLGWKFWHKKSMRGLNDLRQNYKMYKLCIRKSRTSQFAMRTRILLQIVGGFYYSHLLSLWLSTSPCSFRCLLAPFILRVVL